MPEASAPPPLVTIVTPSYNQGEFIAETIDSVIGQNYPPIEYLVMDGGSTDGTVEILRQYGGQLRWESGVDAGQSDAIHRGFALSHGEIIAWINADDLYAPMAISRAVETLQTHPAAALVYGRAELIDREGRITGEQMHMPWDFDTLLNRVNFIPQTATFFRRSAYEAVGGISVDLHYVMDYDLWLKLGRQFEVIAIPDILARVRMYPETKTASGGLPRIEEMRRMIGRHGRSHLPDWHEWDALRAFILAGATAFRSGRRTKGIRFMAIAITHLRHPFVLRNATRFIGRRTRAAVSQVLSRRRNARS